MNKYEQMLADLKTRQQENAAVRRVNNADLPAGSPMHYYCKLCKAETDVLPEEHDERPRQYCTPCQDMVNAGWNGTEFAVYESVTCPECNGNGLGVYDYYLKRRRRCSRCNGACSIRKQVSTVHV